MGTLYGELKFKYQNITWDDEKRYVVTIRGYDFYIYSPSLDETLHLTDGVDFYHMPLEYMKHYKATCPICEEPVRRIGQQSICRKNIQLNKEYNIEKELTEWNVRSVFHPDAYPPIKLEEKISDETTLFR